MEVNDIDFRKIYNDAVNQMGIVNIMLAGKTGVGKSTLINAIFGEDLAQTGKGRPVTQYTKEYFKDNSCYHLFDTKGFELCNYNEFSEDIKDEIQRRVTTDPKEHIHILWYCINSYSNRYEETEITFIREIQKLIPVVVVFTQAERAKDFERKFRNENFDISHTVRILAQPIYDEDTMEISKKAFGLDSLVKLTEELLPESQKKAFAAAQKVDFDLKKKHVGNIIHIAAGVAAGIGATPIPFSDCIALAPVQITMLAKISMEMGLSLDDGFLSTLVAAAAGVVGAGFAGRAIVSGLLKLIPGAGSVIGGTISATTAAALTETMGWAYYKALIMIFASGKNFTTEDIAEAFRNQLKTK